MQAKQLTSILGAAVLLTLLAHVLATTSTPRSGTVVTVTPHPGRPCRLPAVCSPRSPRVCGRSINNTCRRFNNVCELLTASRGLGGVIPTIPRWMHVRDGDCRLVRGVGAANATACYMACPRRMVNCGRTRPSLEICVSTRNQRECKVLANNCQLRNQNCFSRPRNNWVLADKRLCAAMQVGDKVQPCHAIPTLATTPRPTTPRPTRRPTRRPTPSPTTQTTVDTTVTPRTRRPTATIPVA